MLSQDHQDHIYLFSKFHEWINPFSSFVFLLPSPPCPAVSLYSFNLHIHKEQYCSLRNFPHWHRLCKASCWPLSTSLLYTWSYLWCKVWGTFFTNRKKEAGLRAAVNNLANRFERFLLHRPSFSPGQSRHQSEIHYPLSPLHQPLTSCLFVSSD